MRKRLSAALFVVLAVCGLALSACGNLNELSGGPYVNRGTPAPTMQRTAEPTPGSTGANQRPTSGPPEFNVIDTYTNTVTKL